MGAICFKDKLFVLLVISALACLKPLSAWEIHIKNGLSNGQALFVHCKSKDTDLGEQTLSTGAEFKWKFKVNIWRTTLFWCYLRKPNGHEMTFDAFWVEKKTEWLRVKCDDQICNWTAEDNGIYLKDNSSNQDEFIHFWKFPATK
ncbi:S-protein homolog 1-like [Benincasa hispida]|uniref:S-protein homolog 1-like n=1 Tax=Benincasa hispida TaxID=102211 RepID=UPI001900CBB7|nr:S-protein homolog 1-like [Benincasa hispida]